MYLKSQAGKPDQRIVVYFMSSDDANDYLNEMSQGNPTNVNEFRIMATSMEKVWQYFPPFFLFRSFIDFPGPFFPCLYPHLGGQQNSIAQAKSQAGSLSYEHGLPHSAL